MTTSQVFWIRSGRPAGAASAGATSSGFDNWTSRPADGPKIERFARLTGRINVPWEAETLYDMCAGQLDELRAGADSLAAGPVERGGGGKCKSTWGAVRISCALPHRAYTVGPFGYGLLGASRVLSGGTCLPQVTISKLGDAVSTWRDKLGLRSELRLYDARGTAATRLFQAGAELREIATHTAGRSSTQRRSRSAMSRCLPR